MSAGQAVPVDEWLKTFVPLGTYTEDAWSPAGAGVLVVDLPVVWLVTSKRLVRSMSGPVAAFLEHDEGATILDLSEGHAKSGMDWIEHEELDLIISLFPMSPAWKIKAFTQQQCVPSADLSQLQPLVSAGCPYGTIEVERPRPFMFEGSIANLSRPLIHTTAPLLPQNAGAPLFLPGVEAFKLAGVLSRTLLVPEGDPRVPPVRLAEAVGMEPVWDLVRGEKARALRKVVVGTGS